MLSASPGVYIVRISSNVRTSVVHPVAVNVIAPERCLSAGDQLVTQHASPHQSRVYLHIPRQAYLPTGASSWWKDPGGSQAKSAPVIPCTPKGVPYSSRFFGWLAH